ncbi:FK506-binding protein 3-like [Xenia sp. Carnegie-2017]|uniref:FK506-binding protein 3-like n=1 Tax=Xenia sp. Carnegie-2017 TaxID=2897299 RepID=UPI001F04411C|nr:FK506-binding protein 3-like [Xenia sp. Carnegie-2017]
MEDVLVYNDVVKDGNVGDMIFENEENATDVSLLETDDEEDVDFESENEYDKTFIHDIEMSEDENDVSFNRSCVDDKANDETCSDEEMEDVLVYNDVVKDGNVGDMIFENEENATDVSLLETDDEEDVDFESENEYDKTFIHDIEMSEDENDPTALGCKVNHSCVDDKANDETCSDEEMEDVLVYNDVVKDGNVGDMIFENEENATDVSLLETDDEEDVDFESENEYDKTFIHDIEMSEDENNVSFNRSCVDDKANDETCSDEEMEDVLVYNDVVKDGNVGDMIFENEENATDVSLLETDDEEDVDFESENEYDKTFIHDIEMSEDENNVSFNRRFNSN